MMFDNSSHLAYRLAWADRHTIRTDRTDVGLRRPQTNWHETSDRFGTHSRLWGYEGALSLVELQD